LDTKGRGSHVSAFSYEINAMKEKKGNNPDYQMTSSVRDAILEITMTGEVNKSGIYQLAAEGAAIIIEKGLKHVLVDIRTLKGRLGIMDTYSFVRTPAERPKVKFALVDLPENQDYLNFLETTAVNAGLSLKYFFDIDTARAWLKSSNLG